MKSKPSKLSFFLRWSTRTAGRPITFVSALGLLITWFIVGIFWGFSDKWILILDTFATVNASLMVFIIQNTQNRESKALQMKVDGILSAIKEAEKKLIAIEDKEEKELEVIRKQLLKKIYPEF